MPNAAGRPACPKGWNFRPSLKLRCGRFGKLLNSRSRWLALPSSAWKDIGWRPGSQGTLRSRLAAVRVRPAHRDEKRTEPRPEEWLLIEWPKEASEPTKYLSIANNASKTKARRTRKLHEVPEGPAILGTTINNVHAGRPS